MTCAKRLFRFYSCAVFLCLGQIIHAQTVPPVSPPAVTPPPAVTLPPAVTSPTNQHPQTPPTTQLQQSKTDPTANPSPSDNSNKSDQPTPLPRQVTLVYSPDYLINLGGLEQAHPFDIRKYEKIQLKLIEDKRALETDFLAPQPLSEKEQLLVHSAPYLDSLKNNARLAEYLEAPELRFVPLSLHRAVVRPFLTASGGTLLAARQALKSGIGVNLGGGYHHAKPETGEGFCVIADIPIAIRQLQAEKLIKTALIVDVDVHQGNGTIVCLADDPTTFTFSMHQDNIYPIPKEVGDWDVELASGMDDTEYLQILSDCLPKLFRDAKPDICFIVGGCDTLQGDPLAGLNMSHQGIVKRDAMIVAACLERQVPVVLTLGGGYSPDAWQAQYLSIKNLLQTYGLAPGAKN